MWHTRAFSLVEHTVGMWFLPRKVLKVSMFPWKRTWTIPFHLCLSFLIRASMPFSCKEFWCNFWLLNYNESERNDKAEGTQLFFDCFSPFFSGRSIEPRASGPIRRLIMTWRKGCCSMHSSCSTFGIPAPSCTLWHVFLHIEAWHTPRVKSFFFFFRVQSILQTHTYTVQRLQSLMAKRGCYEASSSPFCHIAAD